MSSQAPEPFECFEEQQRSYELLEEHRDALAADAAELAAGHPELALVGLILDAEASEAAAFRAALEQATGQSFAGRGFLGVVPRELALGMLRANAPATLEWLPSATAAADGGSSRTLPLVAVTKGGVRFGTINYEV